MIDDIGGRPCVPNTAGRLTEHPCTRLKGANSGTSGYSCEKTSERAENRRWIWCVCVLHQSALQRSLDAGPERVSFAESRAREVAAVLRTGQALDQFRVVRHVGRRPARPVQDERTGAPLDEQFGDGGVASAGGQVEGRVAVVVAPVEVQLRVAVLREVEQRLDARLVAVAHGQVQRRVALRVADVQVAVLLTAERGIVFSHRF